MKTYDRRQIAMRILLFRETNIRPFLRLRKNNEVKLFKTIYDCADFLELPSETVWEAFLASLPVKGWGITHIKHNDVEATYAKLYWSTIRPVPEGRTCLRHKRPVKMLDIFTQKVKTFCTLTAAGEAIGVRASYIRTRMSLPEKIRLVYGRYIVIDAEYDYDFLTEEKRQAVLESIKWGIIVFDAKKRTVSRFSGLTAYLRLMNKSSIIENARRLLQAKGIYHVDKSRFVMKATYAMNEKTQDELCQLFIEKINQTLFYLR